MSLSNAEYRPWRLLPQLLRAIRGKLWVCEDEAGAEEAQLDRASAHDTGARREVQDYAVAPPDHDRRLHSTGERAGAGLPPDARS